MAKDKIDLLLQELKTIEYKKSIYEKISAHLALLIDDALPNDMLPIAVPKEVGIEVLDELRERLDDLDDERRQALTTATASPKAPARKIPSPPARPKKGATRRRPSSQGDAEPVSLDKARAGKKP